MHRSLTQVRVEEKIWVGDKVVLASEFCEKSSESNLQAVLVTLDTMGRREYVPLRDQGSSAEPLGEVRILLVPVAEDCHPRELPCEKNSGCYGIPG